MDENDVFRNSTIKRHHHVSLKETLSQSQSVTHAGYRYVRRPPEVMNFPVPTEHQSVHDQPAVESTYKLPRITFAPETLRMKNSSHIQEEIHNQQGRIIEQARVTPVNGVTNQSPMTEGIQIYHPLEVSPILLFIFVLYHK